jgi:hypothetical protein
MVAGIEGAWKQPGPGSQKNLETRTKIFYFQQLILLVASRGRWRTGIASRRNPRTAYRESRSKAEQRECL